MNEVLWTRQVHTSMDGKLNGQDFFSQVEKQFGNKVLGPFVKLSRSTRMKGSNFLSFSSKKKAFPNICVSVLQQFAHNNAKSLKKANPVSICHANDWTTSLHQSFWPQKAQKASLPIVVMWLCQKHYTLSTYLKSHLILPKRVKARCIFNQEKCSECC